VDITTWRKVQVNVNCHTCLLCFVEKSMHQTMQYHGCNAKRVNCHWAHIWTARFHDAHNFFFFPPSVASVSGTAPVSSAGAGPAANNLNFSSRAYKTKELQNYFDLPHKRTLKTGFFNHSYHWLVDVPESNVMCPRRVQTAVQKRARSSHFIATPKSKLDTGPAISS